RGDGGGRCRSWHVALASPSVVGQERLDALRLDVVDDQVGASLADAGTRLLVVQVPLPGAHRLDLTSPSDLHTGFGALMGLQLRHASSLPSLAYRLEVVFTTRPRLLNGPSPVSPSGAGSCSCPSPRSRGPSRPPRAR